MNQPATIVSIQSYFAGERTETTILVVGCVVFLAASMSLLILHRDDFSKGLVTTSALGLLVFGGASAFLLQRDPPHERALIASVKAGKPTGVQLEEDRVTGVISKYRYYRWCAVAVTFLAGLITLLVRSGLWTGLAAGLVILAATQMIVDHYSEHRARIYLSDMQSFRSRQCNSSALVNSS